MPVFQQDCCSALHNIDHGNFTTQQGTETFGNFSCGSIVQYQCDHGFTLIGNDTLSCLEKEEEWDLNPPICITREFGTQYFVFLRTRCKSIPASCGENT